MKELKKINNKIKKMKNKINIVLEINNFLQKEDWHMYIKNECCSCPEGCFFNLKNMSFLELFNEVADNGGFGNGYEYYDFIKNDTIKREIKKLFNEAEIDDEWEEYNNKTIELLENLRADDLQIPTGDWDLRKIQKLNNLNFGYYENDKNLVVIEKTPEKQKKYKTYLVYDIKYKSIYDI